jgi:ribosomal protein S18 acetylase RimI-like enzyme
MTSSDFSAPPIDLGEARLLALEAGVCEPLAGAIVAMPPWSSVAYPKEQMTRFLATPAAGTSRYAVEVGGVAAGAVSVRSPWLKGPYLELLAILPAFQGNGVGAKILAWFEVEGLRVGARNLWVCATSCNARALRFYARHGFQPVATLPGLVADGYDDILLRKFPLAAARP